MKASRQMIQAADANFRSALETAKNNLTIPNEIDIVEKIGLEYRKYSALWSDPEKENYDMNWYERGHTAFQSAKYAVDELIALNDATMYRTASNAKNRMQRIIMPGIVAIVAALVFALVFNFFINHYFINPLISITKAVQKVLRTGNPTSIDIETNDELKDLATAVNDLSGLVPKAK
jgi:HAMP domain-containing protein